MVSPISQVSPGKIEAIDCRAPFDPDITSALRPKITFVIKVQDGQAAIMCYSDWEDEPHSGNLMVGSTFPPPLPQPLTQILSRLDVMDSSVDM